MAGAGRYDDLYATPVRVIAMRQCCIVIIICRKDGFFNSDRRRVVVQVVFFTACRVDGRGIGPCAFFQSVRCLLAPMPHCWEHRSRDG